jgi:hypothetical protein
MRSASSNWPCGLVSWGGGDRSRHRNGGFVEGSDNRSGDPGDRSSLARSLRCNRSQTVVANRRLGSPGGFVVVQEYHSGEAGERHRAGDRCDIGRRVRSDPWRKVSALGTIKVN